MVFERYHTGMVKEEGGGRDGAAGMGGGPPFYGAAFLLSTIGFAVARRFAAAIEPFGLEPRDFALLRAIGFAEGQSQQALGERLQIPPSRMVAIVDELERRGLVERRQNPEDRRARALFMTEAGQRLMAQAFEAAAAHDRAVVSELSEAERRELVELLKRVGAPLGVMPGAAHTALRESWPR
jgi:DNA-binding MarR family transcriptional regulator